MRDAFPGRRHYSLDRMVEEKQVRRPSGDSRAPVKPPTPKNSRRCDTAQNGTAGSAFADPDRCHNDPSRPSASVPTGPHEAQGQFED